jgi:hypothetical protein
MATQPEPRRGGDFSPIGNAPLWDGIAHWATVIATGQFHGTASLHTYFGSTVVILILVSLLPPDRSDNWLRFGTAPRATD